MPYLEKLLLLLKFLSPIFYILNTFKNSVYFHSRSLLQVIILMLLVVKFLINFQICDLRKLSHFTFNILEHQSLWFLTWICFRFLQFFVDFLLSFKPDCDLMHCLWKCNLPSSSFLLCTRRNIQRTEKSTSVVSADFTWQHIFRNHVVFYDFFAFWETGTSLNDLMCFLEISWKWLDEFN